MLDIQFRYREINNCLAAINPLTEMASLQTGADSGGGEEKTAMHSQPPPRLMIKKMTLMNFKSYFGKKEIGPFHKVEYKIYSYTFALETSLNVCINACLLLFLFLFSQCFSSIVGPNGSGKSNVIDSLLFVFGKRASKIRLKKISELIHRSSEHRNLQECKVSVHFHEIVDIEVDYL